MAGLQELRQKYPQYNDLTDQQLADSFYNKFYSDIPQAEFYQKIGFAQQPIEQELPQQQPPEVPQDRRPIAGEVARPFLQAAKQVVTGTLGAAGDIAQQATYLPEALGRGAARGLGFDVKPFDYSKVNTASPVIRQAFDTATGGLTEPRGRQEEILETVGEVAGGFVGPAAIKTAAQKTADIASLIGKRAIQGLTGVTQKGKDLIKVFSDSGVNPTLANISEGRGTKTFQNLLGNFPGSRRVIEKAAQQQIDDITKLLAGITKSRGGTIQQTGKTIQEGAVATKVRMKNRINKLYDDLDEFINNTLLKSGDRDRVKDIESVFQKFRKIPPKALGANTEFLIDIFNKAKTTGGAKIPTKNLQAITQDPAIQDVVAVGAGDSARVLKRYADIIDEVGNISYPRLKIFRSTVGKKLQSASLPGDERGAIKKIYGALSEDMKAAVTAQGGKKGLQAFNKANNAFARLTTQIDKKIDPLINAKTPEAVYNMALSGTKQGGSNIKPIMKNLDPVQQEFVRGTVAKRMGLAQSGQQDAFGEVFSPAKFLTEWNKLSPEARINIFTKEQTGSINNLNKVISSLKEASKARQSSNNLPYMAYAGLTGVTLVSPTTGAAAVGGANITARMMTNPKFVKWLAQTPKIRASQIPKHQKTLSIIASQNPALQEDILDYIESITIQKEEENGT